MKLGQCYTRGDTGHLAAKCPRGKGDSKGRPLHAVDPGDNASGDQVRQADDKRGKGCNISSLELGGGVELDHRGNCNLSPLTIEAVEQDRAHLEALEMAVDSGAADTVILAGRLPQIPVEPSSASRRGLTCTAASGHRMPNRGQQRVTGTTGDGRYVKLLLQVTDVNKALCSVRQMCGANNRVVFEKGCSYIQNKETGAKTAIYEKYCGYNMKLNIKAADQNVHERQLNSQVPTHNRCQPLSELLAGNGETICEACHTMFSAGREDTRGECVWGVHANSCASTGNQHHHSCKTIGDKSREGDTEDEYVDGAL